MTGLDRRSALSLAFLLLASAAFADDTLPFVADVVGKPMEVPPARCDLPPPSNFEPENCTCVDDSWQCCQLFPGKKPKKTCKEPKPGCLAGTVSCVDGKWKCGGGKEPKGPVTCVACVPPPKGCSYKGGDCSSCGKVVCPESKPCISCMPPAGCTYKGGDGCGSCGTLDCPKVKVSTCASCALPPKGCQYVGGDGCATCGSLICKSSSH